MEMQRRRGEWTATVATTGEGGGTKGTGAAGRPGGQKNAHRVRAYGREGFQPPIGAGEEGRGGSTTDRSVCGGRAVAGATAAPPHTCAPRRTPS